MFLFHITPSQCFLGPGVCIHIPPLKLVSSQPNLLPKITLIMTHTNIPTHITKHYCCIVTMISEVSCAIYEYISSSTAHITPSVFHQALLANDTVPTVSYFTNKHIWGRSQQSIYGMHHRHFFKSLDSIFRYFIFIFIRHIPLI